MRKYYSSAMFVLSLVTAGLLLVGCGSAKKEGGSQAPTATQNALAIDSATAVLDASLPPTQTTLLGAVNGIPTASLGAASCVNCHATAGSPINVFVQDSRNTPTPAPGVLKRWGLSAHADQGTQVDTSNPLCMQCHDPFGDGVKIDALQSSSGLELALNTNGGTTAVGCEACHGGANMHNGIGPLPAAKPGFNRCGACHSKSWDSSTELASHKTFYPEGYGIYEDFIASPHAKSINSSTLVSGSTTTVSATCSRCHTDEGIKSYLSVASGTQDHDTLVASMTGKAAIENASPVQCRTCHDAHEPGTLIGDKDYTIITDPRGVWSSEFKTCTACHQFLKADGTVNAAYHDPAENVYGSNEEIIADTHFSVAGTPGYNIDPTNDRACSNCHNPHNADNTINNQFAASAHMDKTGSWDEEGDTSSRTCQRCHTTTGFLDYIGRVAANNNGSTPVGIPTALTLTGPGKEMLYCIGCHTNNKGGLRDPKVFQYTISTDTGFIPNRDGSTIRTIPNTIGGSLICVHCHSGRRTGQYNKDIVPSPYRTDHYLPAASIMFRLNGFEYNGVAGATLSYANVSYFAHDKIGTSASAAPGNGNGPCVGCHMYPGATGPANHGFKIFERDANGKIVTNLADANTCSKCHAGQYALGVTALNTVESEYRAAIQALKSVIATKKGLYYKAGDIGDEGAGSFYADVAQTTAATNNAATWGTINDFGAGYNLNVLSYAVPGAGALYHNFVYVKRLIYDSIDYLDNGAIDNSVDATIAAITVTGAYTVGTASEFQITAADKEAARAFLNGGTEAAPARP